MNRKRKLLTKIALAAFCVIIALHYCDPWLHQGSFKFGAPSGWHEARYFYGAGNPVIEDVRMPLFVLAVLYAGLFFLFGGKDTDSVPRRPRDWQRIKQVILNISVFAGGFMVIAGIIGAAIESNEYQRQQERERNALHRGRSIQALHQSFGNRVVGFANVHGFLLLLTDELRIIRDRSLHLSLSGCQSMRKGINHGGAS